MSELDMEARRPPVVFSLFQKLKLLGAFVGMGASMVYGAITGLFRDRQAAPSYKRHMLLETIKALTGNLDALQMQYTAPTYDQVYRDFCKQHSIEPDLVAKNSETIGFWVGSRTAKHIVMHLHGGAFALDITPEHLRFWHRIQQELAQSSIDVSFFFPVYTLVPHKRYPTQFNQAVEALRYLVQDESRKPEDITISGDSAGANLCAAIISHMSHPSAEVPRLELGGKLGGMIHLSPWLSFDTTWPSMTYNAHKDIDTPDVLKYWSDLYLGGRAPDNYSEPALAPAEWWKDAGVGSTLVAVGEHEMFFDGTKAWAKSFKAAGNETKLAVAKGEFHIEPLIMAKFGDETETGVERDIKAWLKERLG